MGVNDVSEAVVEVAWAALNMQQEVELKGLLAAEILENDKLRKSLHVYKKVVEDLALADAVAAAGIQDPILTDSASTASCQEPRTSDVCQKTLTLLCFISSHRALGFSITVNVIHTC
jgi:hypothetical protein